MASMDSLLALFAGHAAATVAVAVLLARLGAPVPAVPFLVLAGAAGASDIRLLAGAFVAASIASTLADGAWYLAGRRWGRGLLGLLCRVSPSPDACVTRSENAFDRRRALTLVASKFVPGLSLVAPPLAGAVGMRAPVFLAINLAASGLWAAAGLAAGLAFHADVERGLSTLQDWGSTAVLYLLAALAAWIAWRAGRRLLGTKLLAILRARPEFLAGVGAGLRVLPRRHSLRALLGRFARRALSARGRTPALRRRGPPPMPRQALRPAEARPPH